MTELGTIERALMESGRVDGDAWITIKAQAVSSRKSAWKTAVAMGYVSEMDALKIISEKFSLSLLNKEEIPDTSCDLTVLNVSSSFLSENKIYPIRLNADDFEVAVSDPATIPLIEAMFVGADKTIKVFLATEEAIHHSLERNFGTGATMMDKIVDRIDSETETDKEIEFGEDPDFLADLASNAPVIELVNLIIAKAIESGASDIHIEPFEKEVFVRYRIDGILHEVEGPPKKMQASVISRIKIMARMNIAEKRLPQDGRIRTRLGGKDIDMRISTVPTVYGESIVMRILDRSAVLLDLSELGFPRQELAQFNKLIERPYGILLVTGPTGSGKTTTLYAALDKINNPDKKIITIEDPVEYQMRGVNQIQVNPKIDLVFSRGLRSIVRQDPDIIMVGEIRDFETAEIAIQASLTGHLVFSTVHTNDSAGAITRLLDMGVEHYLISSALIGAMAQRLVRVVCKKCRKPQELEGDIAKMIGKDENGGASATVYREAGCKECAQTGYRGRTAVYELLVIDDDVRNLILQKTSTHIIKEKARAAGMKTLREDGFSKVRNGVTTISEVLRVTAEEVV